MADKPQDNRPAMDHGEVKVIKNERPRSVDQGKTPGTEEASVQPGGPLRDRAGEAPGSAESDQN
jgi:hypothetical protein